MAYIVLTSLGGILLYTYPAAMESFSLSAADLSKKTLSEMDLNWLQTYRLTIGLYCLALVIGVVSLFTGPIILCSYTITSWNLLISRLLFAYVGTRYSNELLLNISQLLRFPALVGCTITVVVWWTILVPIIHHLTEGKKRQGFWKFNTSFFLINVHFMNLPFIAYEFMLSDHPLYMIDLWMGLCVALAYVLFYLLYLDPHGLHFYIILTPRTVFCIFPYILVLTLYYGTFVGWNYILTAY